MAKVKLLPGTYLAIEAFEKLERKRHQIERAEKELHDILHYKDVTDALADPEQMAEYVRITEEMVISIALGCRLCKTATKEALIQSSGKAQ